MPEENPFDNMDPHCQLPPEARTALWEACRLVLARPDDFTDAGKWLHDGDPEEEDDSTDERYSTNHGYSEAALTAWCYRRYRYYHAGRLRGLRRCVDPYDTYPRRLALQGNLWKFCSVLGWPMPDVKKLNQLQQHPEEIRKWLMGLTIESVKQRGSWREGDFATKWQCRVENNQLVDIGDVQAVWDACDKQFRRAFHRMKIQLRWDRRRGRTILPGDNPRDPAWRLEHAARASRA